MKQRLGTLIANVGEWMWRRGCRMRGLSRAMLLEPHAEPAVDRVGRLTTTTV